MKPIRRQHLLAAALVGALVFVTTTGRADDTAVTNAMTTATATTPAAPAASPEKDEWRFGVTLPLWAPQINGDSTFRGRQRDVNIDYSELKDHLDASFALALQAQKGKFGMFGSVGYMKFSGDLPGPLGGNTSVGLKFVIANAGLSYELARTESEHPFILFGTAGVRYWYASTDISHRFNNLNRDFHGYDNWQIFDPVIGLRASQYITQKLHVDVAGDFGGFNINHDTDLTWSASGFLTYDFAKWFSLSAGYQAVALDESEGNGNTKRGVDLIFSGAAANLTFKF